MGGELIPAHVRHVTNSPVLCRKTSPLADRDFCETCFDMLVVGVISHT